MAKTMSGFIKAALTLCALAGQVATGRAGELADELKAGRLSQAMIIDARPDGDTDQSDQRAKCRLRALNAELESAGRCYDSLIAAAPTDTSLLASRATIAFRAGQYAKARDLYAATGNAARQGLAASLIKSAPYTVRVHRKVYLIKFERRDPLPIVKVRLPDNLDHLFVLDTGAGETVIDPKVAARVGVERVGGAVKGTFAGDLTASVSYGILPNMVVGDLDLGRVPVMLLDTSQFSESLDGQHVDGVIGVDLLRHFRATMDYPRSQLVLAERARDHPTAVLGMRFWLAGDHFILAEGAFNGTPQLALVDTGLAGLACTAPASTLAAASVRLDGETGSGVGGGGAVSATRFTAKSVSLGAASQADVRCVYGPFPASLETSTGIRIGLLVSHAFLARYAVTLDFDRMMLSLDTPVERRRLKGS